MNIASPSDVFVILYSIFGKNLMILEIIIDFLWIYKSDIIKHEQYWFNTQLHTPKNKYFGMIYDVIVINGETVSDIKLISIYMGKEYFCSTVCFFHIPNQSNINLKSNQEAVKSIWENEEALKIVMDSEISEEKTKRELKRILGHSYLINPKRIARRRKNNNK